MRLFCWYDGRVSTTHTIRRQDHTSTTTALWLLTQCSYWSSEYRIQAEKWLPTKADFEKAKSVPLSSNRIRSMSSFDISKQIHRHSICRSTTECSICEVQIYRPVQIRSLYCPLPPLSLVWRPTRRRTRIILWNNQISNILYSGCNRSCWTFRVPEPWGNISVLYWLCYWFI